MSNFYEEISKEFEELGKSFLRDCASLLRLNASIEFKFYASNYAYDAYEVGKLATQSFALAREYRQ